MKDVEFEMIIAAVVQIIKDSDCKDDMIKKVLDMIK